MSKCQLVLVVLQTDTLTPLSAHLIRMWIYSHAVFLREYGVTGRAIDSEGENWGVRSGRVETPT